MSVALVLLPAPARAPLQEGRAGSAGAPVRARERALGQARAPLRAHQRALEQA